MKSLVIIGAGGHARSIIDLVESEGAYQIIGLIGAPGDCIGSMVMGYPIIATDSDSDAISRVAERAIIGIGQIKTAEPRKLMYEYISGLGLDLPIIISPSAYVSKHTNIGKGTAIMHGAIVNSNVVIGNNCILNTLALIEHDAVIGDHCHVSTGARINGGVNVESGCFIGSGAVVYHDITIGRNSVIAGGCIVSDNVPPNSIVRVP